MSYHRWYDPLREGLTGGRDLVLRDVHGAIGLTTGFVRVRPFRDVFDTYNLHYYLSVRIPRLGYWVKELPVRRVYPSAGPTPSHIGGLRARLHILRLLFWAALGRYNPELSHDL